jgi:hypothetical protein
MNMPGFNAENSTHKTISHFRCKVDRTFGSGKNDSQVYMQLPRSQNKPGAACHATAPGENGGHIYYGTYDSHGDCCTGGGKYCINCDNSNNTCDDGNEKGIRTHPHWRDILGSYSIDSQPGRVGTPFMSANRIALRF